VINVGNHLIPGAAEAVNNLLDTGKYVTVISNSAGYAKRQMLERMTGLGLPLSAEQIVTSREAILARLQSEPPRKWGLMIQDDADLDDFQGLDFERLGDDPATYDAVGGFLLIGSEDWNAHRQDLLIAASRQNPRPVLVGNPDLYAPRDGFFSTEPGFYAHDLADQSDIEPLFLGKPFPEIFEMAMARLPISCAAHQVLMVGDTLHTDILGGQAAGMATALVTNHGGLKGRDVNAAIARAGIVPNFVIPRM
jgi:HAD superfamily hydrolase (TIGR01450 family)